MKFTPEDHSVSVTVTYNLRDQMKESGRISLLGVDNSRMESAISSSSTTSKTNPENVDEYSTYMPCGTIIIDVNDEGIGLDEDQLRLAFGEGTQFAAGRAMQHGGGCKLFGL